jgi:hypothetical protein
MFCVVAATRRAPVEFVLEDNFFGFVRPREEIIVATVLRQQTVETVAVDGDEPAQQGDQPVAQPEAPTVTLVRDFHTQLAMNAIRQQEFASLRDLQEWSRLQTSMVAYHGRPPNQN